MTADGAASAATVAIGTDIVRISRWDDHAGNHAFLRRAFTEREIALCGGRPESLAGRWAAKEATLKALGAGIGRIPLTDIEVGRDPAGRPVLSLHGQAGALAREAGLGRWQVSLSHDGDYAVATVLGSRG